MDGEVFDFHQRRHFYFNARIMKVVFPIYNLTWRVNNYVSRQGKAINRDNESTEKTLIVLMLSTSNCIFENLTIPFFPTLVRK